MVKRCAKCKEEKPYTLFSKDKGRKDGYQPYCKACYRAYYHANHKKLRRKQADYYEKNKEWFREHNKNYYKENRDTVLATNRQWVADNYDRAQEYKHEWYENNKDYHAKQGKEWARNNPDSARLVWQRRRARERQLPNTLTSDEWEAIKTTSDNRCLCCGRSDVKLTMDHIIPLSSDGGTTADNIQPLCLSCNSIKHTKTIDYRIKEGASSRP